MCKKSLYYDWPSFRCLSLCFLFSHKISCINWLNFLLFSLFITPKHFIRLVFFSFILPHITDFFFLHRSVFFVCVFLLLYSRQIFYLPFVFNALTLHFYCYVSLLVSKDNECYYMLFFPLYRSPGFIHTYFYPLGKYYWYKKYSDFFKLCFDF